MPSENVYVVTCYHFDDHGDGTEVIRIFKLQTDANEHARAYLNEQYGDDWEEYEETTGSDGSISIHAEGGENEVLDMNNNVYQVVFDESQQPNRYGTLAVEPCSFTGKEVHTLPVGCRGDRFLFRSSDEDMLVFLELHFSFRKNDNEPPPAAKRKISPS